MADEKPRYIKPSELEGKLIPGHDGVEVTDLKAKLTGADGFLAESVSIGGAHMPIGSRVMVLSPSIVDSHEYDRAKVDKEVVDDALVETAVLKAEGCLLLDADLVAEVVEAHNKRIEAARAEADRLRKEAKGIFSLPLDDGLRFSCGIGDCPAAFATTDEREDHTLKEHHTG